VLSYTPTETRAEDADQVTRHRAEPFISMGVPPAFLLDYLVPRPHEGLDGAVSIRQRRSRASHAICGQFPVCQHREDSTPTE
jgi:hypothetical protein